MNMLRRLVCRMVGHEYVYTLSRMEITCARCGHQEPL